MLPKQSVYDVIVVGARCAGSPTAMLLARLGYRVLLVDRQHFPSDSMRCHVIKGAGVSSLSRWGLLEQVAASNCPPIRQAVLDLGDFPLAGPVPSGNGVDAYFAPRRFVLDKILVDAAVAAGAELREGFTVQELTYDGERVTAIRGRSHGGAVAREQAQLVVGADGLHSVVARAVGAPVTQERSPLTFGYYSYFSGVPVEGIETAYRQALFALAFPTNHQLTCVAIQAPTAGFHAFRSDIEGNFFAALAQVPALAARVRAGHREERWLGTADLPNFYRKPWGPGWALVGDAGYHKDPITAQGISDAFRDAELLATAIDAGFSGRQPLDAALAEYERRRNEAAQPLYAWTYARASFAPFPRDVYAARRALVAAAVPAAGEES